jgi:hypothetical protein
MKLDLLHLTSVGDQKQIFGGIGQDQRPETAGTTPNHSKCDDRFIGVVVRGKNDGQSAGFTPA